MQMVLNDLSADFPLQDQQEGKRVMRLFIHMYVAMKQLLKNDRVLLDKDYNGIFLAKDYNILKWRNDPGVDQEEIRVFLSLLNKSGTYESAASTGESLNLSEAEAFVGGKSSLGCLYGYLLNGCMISFDTDDMWRKPELLLTLQKLEGDELSEYETGIPNVSDEHTFQSFKLKYSEDIKQKLLDEFWVGNDILQRKKEIYPNLVFCDNALRQLRDINDPAVTRQISIRLMELQEYFSGNHPYFDKNMLKNATPESQPTLSQYKEEHTFRLPDGRYETFSWHIRFTGIEGRIFFFPEMKNNLCYIGHIGGKLPNVSFN